MRRNWSVTATIIATLVVLLASVSGWGVCQTGRETYNFSRYSCNIGSFESGYYLGNCSFTYCCTGYSRQPCTNYTGQYIGYGSSSNTRFIVSCDVQETEIITQYAGSLTLNVHFCTSQVDVDSANCVNNGNRWDSISRTCKTSSCTADDDTWLKTSIAACQDIQGSNNYSLVDTNDVCEHRGHCCTLDSLIEGASCKWRCESQDSLCTLKKGNFSYAIVADTAVSGSDTIYTGLCYNNCFMYASKDSLTGLVTGNVTAVNNTSMAAGTYYPDGFKGIRSDYGGIYTYDFLSDENYEWADSLLSAPCSVGMYRGVKNGKYVYWKSGQPVPEGVTNVVKVK